MYSIFVPAPNHINNWNCPRCYGLNHKTRYLCKHTSCNYIHIPSKSTSIINTNKLLAMPIESQYELFFAGYLRNQNITNINIPKDVINILMAFMLINLGWNRVKHGRYVDFINHNTIQMWYSPSICIANYIIDSNIHTKFAWTFEIINVGYKMYFGFIILPIPSDFQWNMDKFSIDKRPKGVYCLGLRYSYYERESSKDDVCPC